MHGALIDSLRTQHRSRSKMASGFVRKVISNSWPALALLIIFLGLVGIDRCKFIHRPTATDGADTSSTRSVAAQKAIQRKLEEGKRIATEFRELESRSMIDLAEDFELSAKHCRNMGGYWDAKSAARQANSSLESARLSLGSKAPPDWSDPFEEPIESLKIHLVYIERVKDLMSVIDVTQSTKRLCEDTADRIERIALDLRREARNKDQKIESDSLQYSIKD